MKIPVALLSLMVPLIGVACQPAEDAAEGQAAHDSPPVERWGTVHEVIGQGQVEARVALGDVATPGFWGVGALAGLDGEITIEDGVVWTSVGQADGTFPATEHSRTPSGDAALLFGSHVVQWQRIEIERDVPHAELSDYLVEQAVAHGVDPAEPFVFRVEGPLANLELHVIAGQCPVRARLHGETLETPPFAASYDEARGRLVGIHATDGGGVYAHGGQSLHVHAVLEEPRDLTGHVDVVSLRRGAVLFLP